MTGNEKVILDAGHGGDEPGAIYNGRKEKDDTLRLTLAVGRILEENGVSTLYTRTTDCLLYTSGISVYMVFDHPICNKGQFHLRMPVPEKSPCFIAGKTLPAD